ncbi:L10-interacting MYB domain-containing protein [Sorghum bicolor]|uniref:L10-interacting MYB domain-containing protein n=1 Tax=Sorghum bicolor TaxID=4558 RepID=UPI000B424441|nr:L10-interacting MYB domain-containing protein [Sorghum bicolor]|eukprot:XP_021314612.1 L10-interacting MYB domain-containing protein [Sorghum bicolor]
MPEIDWNVENTRILCGLMAEQVEKGNRPNTFLNSVGYAAIEKAFKDQTGVELNKGQIKNKWDKLKEEFKAWRKKARADIPGCGKFRKHPLQNEDELTICFQGIVNFGSDHWTPCGNNSTMAATPSVTQDEQGAALVEDIDALGATQDDETYEVTPSPGSGKRAARPVQGSGKKAKTTNAVLIQEACTSTASSANAYAAKKDGKFTIDEVMKAVRDCGAEYGTDEHYIATELFVKKEQREMFMTFPTDEIKFNWLTRKYNDKHAK